MCTGAPLPKPTDPGDAYKDMQNVELNAVFGGAKGETVTYSRSDGSFSLAVAKSREGEFRDFLNMMGATDDFFVAA